MNKYIIITIINFLFIFSLSDTYFFNKTIDFIKNKNYDKAEEYYKTIIKRNPDFYQAVYNYNLIKINKNKIQEALENLKKYSNKKLYFKELIGLIYYKQKNYEQAVKYLKESLNTDNNTGLTFLIKSYYKLNNIEKLVNITLTYGNQLTDENKIIILLNFYFNKKIDYILKYKSILFSENKIIKGIYNSISDINNKNEK